MTDILIIKEIIQRATVWIPKGIKEAISVYIAFTVEV